MEEVRQENLLRSTALQNAKSMMLARQRVEEELVRARDFHDAVMANMGEGLYALDSHGAVTYLNAAAERLLGWTASELMGRKMHEMNHCKHEDGSPLPAEECVILRVLRDGIPVRDLDDSFIRKDGGMFPVTLSCSPLKAADKVVGAIVVFRDATERRRAEEAQLHLAAIVASSDDAIVSKDLNGVIRSWNQGAQRIFGYTPEEIVGKPIIMLLPPDRHEEEVGILRRLRRGERVDHFDTIRRHKSGRHIDVSVSISPIRNSQGQLIGASNISRDITARKRVERTTRFLADANSCLTDLTDIASTLHKVATVAVPVFADWCAVDLAEESGSVRRIALIHSDPEKVRLAEEIRRQHSPSPADSFGVQKVMRTRESDWISEITDEFLVQTIADLPVRERVRQLGLRSYICVPLQSRSKLIGAITFAHAESGRTYVNDDLRTAEDLAHRVVIAIENSNLVSALRDSDRRKDEFLAMLAHELRNPLAPIRNAVDIMRDAETSVPEMQWARDVIDRQLDQMTRLIDDLLDVSRITRGKIELRKEPIQLSAVVATAVEASRPLVELRRHELSITMPAQPILLDADPTRLAQVLSNLLNNAAKYMEEGGHIWLTCQREGAQVVIRVKDTGVGIPAEMLPHIFDMFMQVDHSLERSQGGLGIGLTLVQRLVELHGGTVEALSDGPGKGSEFVVRLADAGPAAPATPPTAGGAAEKALAQPSRILVVDDNKDAANGLAKLLRMSGHQVQTAYDGLEALGAAAMFQPDIAILDIGLPKLNGYEVAQRIRMERGDAVKLIAVTGWGQEADRRRSKEAGFDRHLTKPIEFATLKKLLAALATAPQK